MCDCLEKSKENILQHLRDKNPNGIIEEGNFQHKGLSMSGGGWRTYQPFEYEMQNIKKDGSKGAIRKHNISMYHTFCPFCGVKYPELKD